MKKWMVFSWLFPIMAPSAKTRLMEVDPSGMRCILWFWFHISKRWSLCNCSVCLNHKYWFVNVTALEKLSLIVLIRFTLIIILVVIIPSFSSPFLQYTPYIVVGTVTFATTTVFAYWWLVPSALYGLLWWRGNQSGLLFTELLCVYGYSLSIYIPISVSILRLTYFYIWPN